MDALILSTISIILALFVLAENTVGLWKIVQAAKSIQESVKSVQDSVRSIQDGLKYIQDSMNNGFKILQDGQKAIMESLEKIKASGQVKKPIPVM